MAKRTVTTVVSDISGEENAETFQFAIDGTSYEIDLTEAEGAEFRAAFERYVSAGRRTSGRRKKAVRK